MENWKGPDEETEDTKKHLAKWWPKLVSFPVQRGVSESALGGSTGKRVMCCFFPVLNILSITPSVVSEYNITEPVGESNLRQCGSYLQKEREE